MSRERSLPNTQKMLNATFPRDGPRQPNLRDILPLMSSANERA